MFLRRPLRRGTPIAALAKRVVPGVRPFLGVGRRGYLCHTCAARYFYGGFTRNGSAATPFHMPLKESKPLGTRPLQTSLRLALSGAQDVP